MVREIDLDGNKIFLTDTNHVDDQKPTTESNTRESKEPDIPCPVEDVALVKRIDDFAKNESEKTLNDRITFVNNDKENRKACHMYFKTKYPNLGKNFSYTGFFFVEIFVRLYFVGCYVFWMMKPKI